MLTREPKKKKGQRGTTGEPRRGDVYGLNDVGFRVYRVYLETQGGSLLMTVVARGRQELNIFVLGGVPREPNTP